MRFDKLTIKAQEAVVRAQETAQKNDHAEIRPLHLLSALLSVALAGAFAIGDDVVSTNAPLAEGQSIALIPPVSGG